MLKTTRRPAEIDQAMTTVTYATWMSRPLGKATRVVIALAGMTTATLILMTSVLVSNGSWFFILTGVAVAALSVRAALHPSLLRLSLLGVGLIALPLLGSAI